MKNINSFRNWSTARKIRALSLMDEYVKKHAPGYGLRFWRENCPYGKAPEETEANKRMIAEDESLFINALWAFYIALTTDLSWLKIKI